MHTEHARGGSERNSSSCGYIRNPIAMEAAGVLPEAKTLSPQQTADYLRYVKEAKEATKNGDLEEALKLFNLAKDIIPTQKVMSRIQKLQEALEDMAEEDDEFTDVCNSGLLLYRELHKQLFEHQKEGVAFLYSLYKDGRKGGILADDMGLGKTIQIIAFLSGMFDASLVNHVLLIMPTNLINTWVKEFAKWTPGMRVKTFHGPSKDERTRSLRRIQERNGVIITTYQMLINNWQQLSRFNGQEFVWDYVILDEAHKIKSSSTKSAICARAVPASNRLLLTGTPIQNNLQELWSLFDFACQGSLLGTLKTFKMEYENPIIRAREKDATAGEKALGFKMSENLMEIIKPYFLRRTKEEVQKKKIDNPEDGTSEENIGVYASCEMPSLTRKNDLIIWIRLVPLQEEIYRKFVSLDHIKELLMETRSPLAELGVLKKLCDHPRLLSARACHLLNIGTVKLSAQDGNEEEDSSDMNNIDHITDDTLMKESGKMIFLMALLKRLKDEGHQTLVFSQSRQILNIIERLLKNRHFKTLRIDGTITHLLEREKRIQLFQQNKEYSVFLLTTQVGGVGLTLTAATRVIIFDPSWNPATDAQAVDRVYRIGQKENVVVYRLITCGTVEEKIYRRQVFKDSLIRQTTGDKKNPFRYFTKQELRELFTIEDFQNSATQLQLQSLHAAQRRSDEKLDVHIAYLHSVGIAGISDHDLMYARDLSVKEELDVIEESPYIQQRVQKAQFLVEFESQNKMEKQGSGNEEAWLRASLLPSQIKKCPESYKPQPRPLPLIATHPTQEEDISSQMANISIADQSRQSESQGLSRVEMSDTVLHDGRHQHENTFDADSVVTVPKGVESVGGIWTDSLSGTAKMFVTENETMQKKALQEGLQENLLGSFNYLPSPGKAELGPNLELQDGENLHHYNLQPNNPINDPQNTESNVSVIEISEDLSVSHSALQGVQENELEEDPSASSRQYVCDFNLFLEDSADNGHSLSGLSLEHDEKENKLSGSAANPAAESVHNLSLDSSAANPGAESVHNLSLDSSAVNPAAESVHNLSLDSSAANPGAESVHNLSLDSSTANPGAESVHNLSLDSSAVNPAAESVHNLSLDSSAANPGAESVHNLSLDSSDEPEDEVIVIKNRHKGRRIVSDDEDENDSFKGTSSPSSFSISPFQFSSVKQSDTSTPKNDMSSSGMFSPKIADNVNKSVKSRRSLASRRSLINVVLDHIEDMEEKLDDKSDAETVQDLLEEENSDEASEHTEEEPSGEILSSENNPSTPIMSKPSSPAPRASPGASEPFSGERLVESPQDKAAEAANDYETLVARGKELKECGKIQEALNCLVKALDIKSADPEVMLMTLNLYKQLSNT